MSFEQVMVDVKNAFEEKVGQGMTNSSFGTLVLENPSFVVTFTSNPPKKVLLYSYGYDCKVLCGPSDSNNGTIYSVSPNNPIAVDVPAGALNFAVSVKTATKADSAGGFYTFGVSY